MLNQNLFRDNTNPETPDNATLIKQFQIASDVANDLLDDDACDDDLIFTGKAADNSGDSSWGPAN